MNSAAISADVVSYTSLSTENKRFLNERIKYILQQLDTTYKNEAFYGRNVQGDTIECTLNKPQKALRIAIILKTFIKSLDLPNKKNNQNTLKYFKEHGIRLALAVAPLTEVNKDKGIIDGEAIYLSGRAIKNMSTSDKQKIIIKESLFFCSNNKQTQQLYQTILTLLDTLLAKCSAKQCEVIYLKLLGMSEKQLVEKLNKSQSTISQHSNAAGWHAIQKSVLYFEENIQ